MATHYPVELLLQQGHAQLLHDEPELYALLQQEHHRQQNSLMMVAASSMAEPSVLVCEATALANLTTEGYPGARFHAGCTIADQIEMMAIDRSKAAFGASYANVQPHSGTSANQIVLFSLLRPGDTMIGMALDVGGHLSHGAKISVVGQYFNPVGYRLGNDGLLDYEQIYDLALQHRPKLIICGASAYPRTINFARFREIADAVGAWLLADISHIAGLVATGMHSSPIDHAHVTTTSTYKQLYGPRGGLILSGRAHATPVPAHQSKLSAVVQRAVFPFFQGTPHLHSIAAKARALGVLATPQFAQLTRHIVASARHLAEELGQYGFEIVTGGTDNHIVLVDIWSHGITGANAERALEECNIIVNRNRIPGDLKPAQVTSGLRIGTNSIALRGLPLSAVSEVAAQINRVLRHITVIDDRRYTLDEGVRRQVQAAVAEICASYPLPSSIGQLSYDSE